MLERYQKFTAAFRVHVDEVTKSEHGESYAMLFRYFLPELITTVILFVFLNIVDAAFIAHLKSTDLYRTQGIGSTLIHFITKIAEGLSVGTVVLCGQYNGTQRYEQVGRAAVSAFWTTVFTGACIALGIALAAPKIYAMYRVPAQMAAWGASFLRLRAIAIFLAFVYFALIGFLRGIKNTRVPMMLFMVGAVIFVFFDYALIFGAWGFPELQLQGSAIAAIMQYSFMLIAGVLYVACTPEFQKYRLQLFAAFNVHDAFQTLKLSWPVMLDKALFAGTRIWLGLLCSWIGAVEHSTFSVVKDMEQLVIVPAVAFGQIITFLVSNDYSRHNWQGIITNIKRVMAASMILVSMLLIPAAIWPASIIRWFDRAGVFTDFAARAFTVLSVLVICDLLQLILAAALRGAANVQAVVKVRAACCLLFFVPVSLLVYLSPISSGFVKFVLLYGSFYLMSGIMAMMYIARLRGEQWKDKVLVHGDNQFIHPPHHRSDGTAPRL